MRFSAPLLVCVSLTSAPASAATIDTLVGLRPADSGMSALLVPFDGYGCESMALDTGGNLIIADESWSWVWRLDSDDNFTLVAGTFDLRSHGPDGVPALATSFQSPRAVTIDSAGNIIVADDSRIRRIDAATGLISTIAGGEPKIYAGDGGPASAARFGDIRALGVDAADNLYVYDGSYCVLRRVLAADGRIFTIAGNGYCGTPTATSPATAASLASTSWLVVAENGDAFFSAADDVWRATAPTTSTGPGAGLVIELTTTTPRALAAVDDGAGGTDLYVAIPSYIALWDHSSSTLTNVVGCTGGSCTATSDPQDVPAASLVLDTSVNSLRAGASGELLVGTTRNTLLRVKDGFVSRVAGNIDNGFNSTLVSADPRWAGFSNIRGLATTADGTIYVADYSDRRVRRIDPAGVITEYAGDPGGGAPNNGDGGPATAANFGNPAALAIGPNDNLYILDRGSAQIRVVDHTTGIISTFSGDPTCPAPDAPCYATSIAFTSTGKLVYTQGEGIFEYDPALGTPTRLVGDPAGSGDDFIGPSPALTVGPFDITVVAVLPNDDVVFDDGNSYRVYEYDRTEGTVRARAGVGQDVYYGWNDPFHPETVPGLSQGFGLVSGLAVDGSGNLLIADYYNTRVWLLTPGDWAFAIAGRLESYDDDYLPDDGGPATLAWLDGPLTLAWSPHHRGLLVVNWGETRVRLVSYGVPSLSKPTLSLATVSRGEPFTAEVEARDESGPAALAVTLEGRPVGSTDWLPLGALASTAPDGFTYRGTLSVAASAPTGTWEVRARATNAGGDGTGDAAGALDIANALPHLVAPMPTTTATAGQPAVVSLYALALDFENGAALTWALDPAPATVDAELSRPDVGLFVLLPPTPDFQGPIDATATATDADGGSVSTTVEVSWVGLSETHAASQGCSCGAQRGVDLFLLVGALLVLGRRRLRRGASTLALALVLASAGTAAAATIQTIVGFPPQDGRDARALAWESMGGKGVAIDASGNVYAVGPTHHWVIKISPAGAMTRVVGEFGALGSDGDGGPAVNAHLNSPSDIALDSAGNLYIADTNNYRIRRVDAGTGVITTVAGSGSCCSASNGALALSSPMRPVRIALDGANDIYFYDYYYSYSIWRVTVADGRVHRVAGNGSTGTPTAVTSAITTPLPYYVGFDVDPTGNLYVSEGNTTPAGRIWRIEAPATTPDPGGAVSLELTTGATGYVGLAAVADGASGTDLYVVADGNRLLMWDDSAAATSVVVGPCSGTCPYTLATLPPAGADVSQVNPQGQLFGLSARDGTDLLLVTYGGAVFRLNAGRLYPFLGTSSGGPNQNPPSDPHDASMLRIKAMTVAPSGAVYFTDNSHDFIYELSPAGALSYWTGTTADLRVLYAEPSGDLLAVEDSERLVRFRHTDRTREVVLQGSGNCMEPTDPCTIESVAVTSTGNIVWLDTGWYFVVELDPSTGERRVLMDPGTIIFDDPVAVVVSANDDVIVADADYNRMWRYDRQTDRVELFAGTGSNGLAPDGAPAIYAPLGSIQSLAATASGNVLYADGDWSRVRLIDRGGILHTLAGSDNEALGDGGDPLAASLRDPFAVAWSPYHHGFVIAESGGQRLRLVTLSGIPGISAATLSGAEVRRDSSLDAEVTATSGDLPVTALAVSITATLQGGTATLSAVAELAADGPFTATLAPTAATPLGTYDVSVTASDGLASTSGTAPSFTVTNVPPTLNVALPRAVAAMGTPASVHLAGFASDFEDIPAALVWSLTSVSVGTIDEDTSRLAEGHFVIRPPTVTFVGTGTAEVVVTDKDGGTATASLDLEWVGHEATGGADGGCGCSNRQGAGGTGLVALFGLWVLVRRRR